MAKIGYFLSGEQFGPRELIDQAKRAEEPVLRRCGFLTTSTRGTTSKAKALSSGE
jgi:hypothetical protein